MQRVMQQLSMIGQLCRDELFLTSLRFFAQDYVPLSMLETYQGSDETLCRIFEQKESSLDRNCDYLQSILTCIQVKLQSGQVQAVLDRVSLMPRPKLYKSLKHLAVELDTQMKASPPRHFQSLLFLAQTLTRHNRLISFNSYSLRWPDTTLTTRCIWILSDAHSNDDLNTPFISHNVCTQPFYRIT